MGWTAKQLADAKRMYKAKGNRKTWPECIAAATKGGKKIAGKKTVKRAARPGSVTKKVTTKRVAVTRIAGISGDVLRDYQTTAANIQRQERIVEDLQSKKMGSSAQSKRVLAAEIKRQKQYIAEQKKHKQSIKKFL